MNTTMAAKVDSLDVRPSVIINPRSYYMAPRVKQIEATSDEVVTVYEELSGKIADIRDDVAANTRAIQSLTDAIENMSGVNIIPATAEEINAVCT